MGYAFRDRVRSVRLGLATVAAAIATLAVAAPARAAELPPQGLYEQCAPNSTELDCGARLDRMGSAGFETVLNYTAWFGNQAEVLAYADRADRAGIKVIWPLNHPAWRGEQSLYDTYRYLRGDCGCSSDSGFFSYAINLVKDHPATWGYYIGDELPADRAPAVERLAERVREATGGRLPLLYVSQENTGSMGRNLAPFAEFADVAAGDHYPVGWDGDSGPASVGPVARAVRDVAVGAGSAPGFVVQAFSWAQYPQFQRSHARWPTRAEMLEMRDLALANGRPRVLLWYSFNDVFRSDDPERRWGDVVSAAFAPVPSGEAADGADGPRPAKLALRRALVHSDGSLDVLARITKRASGRIWVRFRSAGRTATAAVPIDSDRGRVRFRQRLPNAMRAALRRHGTRTGIIELHYPGGSLVRPQGIRSRVAPRPARLRLHSLRVGERRFQASGTVSRQARGVVRVHISYLDEEAETQRVATRAPISSGRWTVTDSLPPEAHDAYASVQYTGNLPRQLRGELVGKAAG